MARRREHLSAYLRTCISAYLRDKKSQKKTGNNRPTPSENSVQHLKKKVPAGSNAYLRSCVFSKEITALGLEGRGQSLVNG